MVAEGTRMAKNREEDLSERVGHVSKGCEVRGRLEYDGSVRISGVVEGEVIVRDSVTVEADGVIHARIECDRIQVKGLVEGDIMARSRIEIRSGGEVYGDVTTSALSVEEGAIFDGRCKMGRKGDVPPRIDRKGPDAASGGG